MKLQFEAKIKFLEERQGKLVPFTLENPEEYIP